MTSSIDDILAAGAPLAWATMTALVHADPLDHYALAGLAGAGYESERVALAVRLSEALAEVQANLAMTTPPPSPAEMRSRSEAAGMLWLDALAADILERFGPRGTADASKLRSGARARWTDAAAPPLWRLWHPREAEPGARIAQILANVLLMDVVRAQVPAPSAKPPGLPIARIETLASFLRPGGRALAGDAGQVLVDRQGRAVAPLTRFDPPLRIPVVAEGALTLLTNGAKLLGGLDAHRLVRWLVATAHRQALAGTADYRAIRIRGGWEGLSQAIGASDDGRKILPAVLMALAHLSFDSTDGGRGNLLSYRETRAAGHHQAVIEVVLGTGLLPYQVFTLKEPDRRIVPLPSLPPFVPRQREHPAQATLQLHLVMEFRRRARELVERGGIRVSPDIWARLAAAAGLPPATLPRVLERWVADGDDGPAFLRRLDGETITLGDSHAEVLEFLRDGGRRELEGAAAGRRGRGMAHPPRPHGPRHDK